MFGCKCFYWSKLDTFSLSQPLSFSLPSPLPHWPPGQGFASGKINLGEIEVRKVCDFELIWSYKVSQDKRKCVSFYRPAEIPDGFYSLGHYCQCSDKPLRGFLLVARDVGSSQLESDDRTNPVNSSALQRPLDYVLIWSSDDWMEDNCVECGYFWLPCAPEGYKPMGFLVTNSPSKPSLDEVRCVRADLTEECQVYRLILNVYSKFSNFPFQVWSARPCCRGMGARGASVGTFFCCSYSSREEKLDIACLKNLNSELHAMPNLEQIHALIDHYGPRVYFHPDEIYLPSSVSWFFEKGALLYKAEGSNCEPIDQRGSNLPAGGSNDRTFWIDLPNDERRNTIKRGNLESSKLYVHVKPALGGTYTDIAMWVFCPFNGPGTLKLGVMSIPLGKIGQHVGDWEHFTLRICNFTGELWSVYFSQHSGGKWVEACDLEYAEGNKPIVYSSKNGHASYPHPGTYLQGSAKLGIGIRNDAARSNSYVDSSKQYEIIAAEYLDGNKSIEPHWLQYMREWGPKIVYNSRSEVDKIINILPSMLRSSFESIFHKLPMELYGEEGPTGPKEKNNWEGDERG